MHIATVIRTDSATEILAAILTSESHRKFNHTLHFLVFKDEVKVYTARPTRDGPAPRSYYEVHQSNGQELKGHTADWIVKGMLAWADASLAS